MNPHGRAHRVLILAAFLGGGLLSTLALSPALPASVDPGHESEASTPDGAVLKVCTACHGIEIVTDTPKDYDAWHDTVQQMIDRGAKGTPEEFDLVMQYLYENMTTVDVNHADAESLGVILHAPPAAVAAIIARRKAQPFKSLAELETAVPGLDRAALEAKKRMIFFQ